MHRIKFKNFNLSEIREERHNKKYIIYYPRNTNSFNEGDILGNVGLIIKKNKNCVLKLI